jgi:hypothetical protein
MDACYAKRWRVTRGQKRNPDGTGNRHRSQDPQRHGHWPQATATGGDDHERQQGHWEGSQDIGGTGNEGARDPAHGSHHRPETRAEDRCYQKGKHADCNGAAQPEAQANPKVAPELVCPQPMTAA